jgi:hypothetical protein
MGWEDFALKSMEGTRNTGISPLATYNAFNQGAQQKRQSELDELAAQKEKAAFAEDSRNKTLGQLQRYAESMKKNTPEYRASVYPQIRQKTIEAMPELAQIMPEQWDEKYIGELDALISHSGAAQTTKPDYMSVGENASVFNKSDGSFVGGGAGAGNRVPKKSMVSVQTVDPNGQPVTRQVMRMDIPEINGYWVDGFIVTPQYPQGIPAEQYQQAHGQLPPEYMLGSAQDGAGRVPTDIPHTSMPSAQQRPTGAPAASGNPAANPRAQGFPIGGNEPAPKPTPLPAFGAPTERKRGALPLPSSAPPPQLDIAPDVEEPMGMDMSQQPIQGMPEQGLPFKPYANRQLADENAPQGMNAMRPMVSQVNDGKGGGNALAYPKYQAPNKGDKTTMSDLWVRAAQGDESATAAVVNAEQIKAAIRGGKVRQATVDSWAEARGNYEIMTTTLDEVREFRQQLERGEYSMNMLGRAVGSVRSMFNDSPDTYVKGSMMNAALQDMVNARLMANKGVQTDGDAERARSAILAAVDSNDDKTIIAALKRAERYLALSQKNFGRSYRQTEQQYPMLKSAK